MIIDHSPLPLEKAMMENETQIQDSRTMVRYMAQLRPINFEFV